MITLDTNVLSALMRTEPKEQVVRWLDRQPAESVWTASITLFEARFGIALLPQGGRRRTLEQSFARVPHEDLENRILDFDISVHADLRSARSSWHWPTSFR